MFNKFYEYENVYVQMLVCPSFTQQQVLGIVLDGTYAIGISNRFPFKIII